MTHALHLVNRQLRKRSDITSMTTRELRTILKSTNPDGRFAVERMWAEKELKRRASAHSEPSVPWWDEVLA